MHDNAELRVLVVTNMYPSARKPFYGTFVRQQVNSLKKNGIKVELIKDRGEGKSIAQIILKYSRISLDLLKKLVKNDFRIVHAHYIFPTGFLSLPHKFFRKRKLFVTAHRGDVIETPEKNFLYRELTRFTLKEADVIIAVSEEIKDLIVEKFGVERDKLKIIDMGVDTAQFFPLSKEKKKRLRKDLGVGIGEVVLLFVGNEFDRKGLMDILKALTIVKKEIDRTFLLFVIGEGRGQIKTYQSFVRDSGLSDIVKFLGALPHEDISRWMKASDIFLLPSHSEGLPIALLEAMATGNCVITSKVGGIPAIVIDGQNGFLIEPGDVDKLAELLKKVIPDKGLRSLISAKAIETAFRNSSEAKSRRLKELYSKVLDKAEKRESMFLHADAGEKRESRKSVLLVGPVGIGGVATSNRIFLSSELLNSKFEMRLVDTTRPPTGLGKEATFNLFNLKLAINHIVKYLIELFRWRPNLVQIPITSDIGLLKYSVFFQIAKFMRIPVILHLHGGRLYSFYKESNKFVKAYVRNMLRRGDSVVVMGEIWKKRLQEMGIRRSIIIIPNTVEFEFASYFEGKSQEDLLNARLNDDTFTVLYVGRLSREKGTFDLLEVASRLKSIGKLKKPIKIILAGPFKNSETRKAIEDFLAHESLADIVVIRGVVTGENKMRLYENASLFVLPSYIENFPITLVESLAAGLPVISTSVGAIGEIIRDKENGYLLRPGDIDGLLRAVLNLASNGETYRKISLSNRERFHREYSPTRILSKWLTLYSSIIH